MQTQEAELIQLNSLINTKTCLEAQKRIQKGTGNKSTAQTNGKVK